MTGREVVRTKAYLDVDEVHRLEEAATNLRDRLLVRLLARLGCRITEAINIEVDDIDLDAATVRILHLKKRIGISCPACGARLGVSHAYCPGCGERVKDAVRKELEHRRQRVLPIDRETLALIRKYVDRGGPVKRRGRVLIFGINRHRAWQIVRECADRAGLPRLVNPQTGKVHGVSPHKLRDAFAVNAMKIDDSGDGMRMLQEHLGHASFATTAGYRKVAGQESREWFDKLWNEGKP